MQKTAEIKAVFNGSIMELRFNTIPRRGWFKDNVQPVIDVIKTAIPGHMREYDPARFTWAFAIEVWPTVKAIVENTGFVLEEKKEAHAHVNVPEDYVENFYHEAHPAKTTETKESVAKQLEALLESVISLEHLSEFELKKLYRQKARQLHPDMGGDAAKMAELNRLWSIYNAN